MTSASRFCSVKGLIGGACGFIFVIAIISIVVYVCTTPSPAQAVGDINQNKGNIEMTSDQETSITVFDISTTNKDGSHGYHCWGIISTLGIILMLVTTAIAVSKYLLPACKRRREALSTLQAVKEHEAEVAHAQMLATQKSNQDVLVMMEAMGKKMEMENRMRVRIQESHAKNLNAIEQLPV